MYAEDLAHIQDEGYGNFAHQAAPGLLGLLRKAGVKRGTVLDLGCGAGVWLRALQRAGYTARGIEFSAALARRARRAAPGAKVAVGSIYSRPLPSCDAMTALSEVLNYSPPRGEVEEALRDAGFSVRVLRRYGRADVGPDRLAFRARKR